MILQVVYLNHARRKQWRLSSYRSEGGAEVDLVVDGTDGPIGIEVKAGRRVGPADSRGLASLAELIPKSKKLRRWILYRGDRRQRLPDGTDVWPVLDGLQALGEMPAS